MKLRCPYCKHTFGPDPKSACPKCGKALIVPDHLRKVRFKDRKKASIKRERVARREDLGKSKPVQISAGARSRILFGSILVMVLVGVVLIQRTKDVYDPDLPEWEVKMEEELTAQGNVNVLRAALEAYKKDCARYPTQEQGLYGLVVNLGVPFWDENGPYINRTMPDPWGSDYQYENIDENIKVFSCGPDKIAGTDDDILPVDAEVKRLLGQRDAGEIPR